jgi:O-succinylbenzoic acid--CoA ligase
MAKSIAALSLEKAINKFSTLKGWEENTQSIALLNPRLDSGVSEIALLQLNEEIKDLVGLYENHVFILSSGTGGRARWVGLSKKALLENARAVVSFNDIRPKESWALFLPLHHVGGLSILARASLIGAHVVSEGLHQKWSAQLFGDVFGRVPFGWTSLVPTQCVDLLEASRDSNKWDFISKLRGIFVGGAALQEKVLQAMLKKKWPVIPTYGMSECGSQVATSCIDDPERKLILLDIWEIEKIEQENVISGSSLASYVTGLGLLNSSFVLPDLVELRRFSDQSGKQMTQVIPRGRKADQIKVLGELVSLSDIETRLKENWCGTEQGGEKFLLTSFDHDRKGNEIVLVSEVSVRDEVFYKDLFHAVDVWNSTALGFEKVSAIYRVAQFQRTELGKPIKNFQKEDLQPVLDSHFTYGRCLLTRP